VRTVHERNVIQQHSITHALDIVVTIEELFRTEINARQYGQNERFSRISGRVHTAHFAHAIHLVHETLLPAGSGKVFDTEK
jgi:hypothetical protein